MSETTMLAVINIARLISVIAAICAAWSLASAGKGGWGWMILLAVVLGSYSLSYKND